MIEVRVRSHGVFVVARVELVRMAQGEAVKVQRTIKMVIRHGTIASDPRQGTTVPSFLTEAMVMRFIINLDPEVEADQIVLDEHEVERKVKVTILLLTAVVDLDHLKVCRMSKPIVLHVRPDLITAPRIKSHSVAVLFATRTDEDTTAALTTVKEATAAVFSAVVGSAAKSNVCSRLIATTMVEYRYTLGSMIGPRITIIIFIRF